jgi:hypothetical protein
MPTAAGKKVINYRRGMLFTQLITNNKSSSIWRKLELEKNANISSLNFQRVLGSEVRWMRPFKAFAF